MLYNFNYPHAETELVIGEICIWHYLCFYLCKFPIVAKEHYKLSCLTTMNLSSYSCAVGCLKKDLTDLKSRCYQGYIPWEF